MPAIARGGDSVSTGHGCDAVTILDNASTGSVSNVFMNGIPVCCIGDKTIVHSVPGGSGCVTHIAVINAGSSTVFVGGKGVARIGDSCDSGVIISGSGNIFCN